MKYDDASWHYGGNFPDDLPDEAGATHAGMFLAWVVLAGLGGEGLDDVAEDVERLRARELTPGRFLLEVCDETLTSDDLGGEADEFCRAYYVAEEDGYLADYDDVLGGELPSLYHVADSWENFDRLRPVLDRRLAQWREA